MEFQNVYGLELESGSYALGSEYRIQATIPTQMSVWIKHRDFGFAHYYCFDECMLS